MSEKRRGSDLQESNAKKHKEDSADYSGADDSGSDDHPQTNESSEESEDGGSPAAGSETCEFQELHIASEETDSNCLMISENLRGCQCGIIALQNEDGVVDGQHQHPEGSLRNDEEEQMIDKLMEIADGADFPSESEYGFERFHIVQKAGSSIDLSDGITPEKFQRIFLDAFSKELEIKIESMQQRLLDYLQIESTLR